MKKAIFFGLFGLLWFCLVSGCSREESPTTGPGETYSLYGYVRHSVTNDKVPGVIVEVAGQVCTTNSAGYYYFNDILSGNHHLTARRDGDVLYEADVQVAGLVQYDFKVDYVVSLYGWVRHSVDGAIAGAIIQVGDQLDTTSVTGYYEFVLFVPGELSLTCSKDGYKPFVMDISITGDFTRADVELTRSHALVYGTVSHSVDGPVDNVIVNLGTMVDTTSIAGYFQFEAVPKGSYQLDCEVPGYDPIHWDINVVNDVYEINITLDKLFTLSGQVYHIEDGPIEGAIVTVGAYSDVTDENGNYDIDNIPEGKYEITCDHEEYNEFVDIITISENGQTLDIRLLKTLTAIPYFITEDAYVQYSGTNYNNTTPNSNYGQSGLLWLGYAVSYIDCTTYDLRLYEIYLKLPDIINRHEDDTIFLILRGSMWFAQQPDLADRLRINVVTGNWEEDIITWANKPNVTSPSIGDNFPYRVNGDSIIVDLREYYEFESDSRFGVRFRIEGWGIPYDYGSYNCFSWYSSECSVDSLRPKVIGTFTY